MKNTIKILTEDRKKRVTEYATLWTEMFRDAHPTDKHLAETSVKLLWAQTLESNLNEGWVPEADENGNLDVSDKPAEKKLPELEIIWCKSPQEAIYLYIVQAISNPAEHNRYTSGSDHLRNLANYGVRVYDYVSGPAASELRRVSDTLDRVATEFAGWVVAPFSPNRVNWLERPAPNWFSTTQNGEPLKIASLLSQVGGASVDQVNELLRGRLNVGDAEMFDRIILNGLDPFLQAAVERYIASLQVVGLAGMIDTLRDVFEVKEFKDRLTVLTGLVTQAHGWISTPRKVWMVERATALTYDDQNRLHNEKSAAINFPGHKIYFWHGVRVNEKVVTEPEKITVEQIQDEPNAEVQRVMIHLYGPEKYIQSMDLKAFQTDKYGTLYRAYNKQHAIVCAMVSVVNKTPEGHWEDDPNCPAGEYTFPAAEYVPAMGDILLGDDGKEDDEADWKEPGSTVRVYKTGKKFIPLLDENGQMVYKPYWLAVPPNTATAHGGVAWSFRKDTWSYDPKGES